MGSPVPSEVLEQRAVMTANVIASLSNGVLTIEGTDRNDKIIVQQVDGQLSIQGVRINVDGKLVNSVAASDVHGININGRRDVLRRTKTKLNNVPMIKPTDPQRTSHLTNRLAVISVGVSIGQFEQAHNACLQLRRAISIQAERKEVT